MCVCSEVVVLYGHHKTLVSFRRAPSGEPRVNGAFWAPKWALPGLSSRRWTSKRRLQLAG